MKKPSLILSAFLAIIMFGSCAGVSRQLLQDGGQIGDGDTVVVGKIVVSPPIAEDEQQLDGIGWGGFKNTMIIINDTNYREVDTSDPSPQMSDLNNRIEAPLGETFYALVPNQPLYFLQGAIYMKAKSILTGPRSADMVIDAAYYPFNAKVDIQPGDKAVYIGTVHFYRDEFQHITRIVLEDNYNREVLLFRQKFGTGVKLRKAFLIPVKTAK